jgi:replicative DNA helicase
MNMSNLDIYGNVPPSSIDAEEALLGSLLTEPESYFRIQNTVRPEHFYKDDHQKIFCSIAEMHRDAKTVDLITLVKSLKANGKLEEVGGPVKLTNLQRKVSSAYNIEHYADIVADDYFRRAAIITASKIQMMAYDSCDVDEISQVWNEFEKEKISLFAGNDPGSSMNQILIETLNEIEKRVVDANKGITPGISTGFRKLDSMTGGWRDGRLVVIGGRPGHGKSSVALHFAHVAAQQKIPVLFFSLEMMKTELAEILLSGNSGISRTDTQNGKVSDSDFIELQRSARHIGNLPLRFFDNPDLSINQIIGIIKSHIRKHGKSLVVIDYLQLIRPEKTSKVQIREQQIAEISRALKRLTLSEKIPVILLSQLNRQGDTEEPKLSHLRESGAIEQDADIVLFVWKPSKDGLTNDSDVAGYENLVQLKVAKNRQGRLGTLVVYENGQMTRFSEEPFSSQGIYQRSKGQDNNPDSRIESTYKTPF